MAKSLKPNISKKSVELIREGMKKHKDKLTGEYLNKILRERRENDRRRSTDS